MSAAAALFRREFGLAFGGGGGPLVACAFYASLTLLLPLSAGPSPERLAAVAPGVAWLALAVSSLLSLERLYERDYEDGALDLLALGPLPLELTCVIKALAQWCATGLPLALATPLAAAALGAPLEIAPLAVACALIGGLSFAAVGGAGAALAIGARRGGVLIAVIVLPLFAPPVIFGAGALEAWRSGLDWTPGFLLLCAYALAAVGLSPLAAAAAVRNALS